VLHFLASAQAGVHGHVFVNGGNLVALNGSGRGWPMAWHEFTTSFRWSVVSGSVWLAAWLSGWLAGLGWHLLNAGVP
jgi:hypothetical protein